MIQLILMGKERGIPRRLRAEGGSQDLVETCLTGSTCRRDLDFSPPSNGVQPVSTREPSTRHSHLSSHFNVVWENFYLKQVGKMILLLPYLPVRDVKVPKVTGLGSERCKWGNGCDARYKLLFVKLPNIFLCCMLLAYNLLTLFAR